MLLFDALNLKQRLEMIDCVFNVLTTITTLSDSNREVNLKIIFTTHKLVKKMITDYTKHGIVKIDRCVLCSIEEINELMKQKIVCKCSKTCCCGNRDRCDMEEPETDCSTSVSSSDF